MKKRYYIIFGVIIGVIAALVIYNLKEEIISQIYAVDDENVILLISELDDYPEKSYIVRKNLKYGNMWKIPYGKTENPDYGLYTRITKNYIKIIGEQLYITCRNNDRSFHHLVIDYQTGKIIKDIPLPGLYRGSAYFLSISGSDRVYYNYIENDKGRFSAINHSTGETAWEVTTDLLEPECVIDRSKYLILHETHSKKVYFFNKMNGKLKTINLKFRGVALDNYYIYFEKQGNSYVFKKIDLNNLRIKRMFTVKDKIVKTDREYQKNQFIVFKDMIIYQCFNKSNSFKAVSINNGKLKWESELPDEMYLDLYGHPLYVHLNPDNSAFYRPKTKFIPIIIKKDFNSIKMEKLITLNLLTGRTSDISKNVFQRDSSLSYNNFSNTYIFYKSGIFFITFLIPYNECKQYGVLLLDGNTGNKINCFNLEDAEGKYMFKGEFEINNLFPSIIGKYNVFFKKKRKLGVINIHKNSLIYKDGFGFDVKYTDLNDIFQTYYSK